MCRAGRLEIGAGESSQKCCRIQLSNGCANSLQAQDARKRLTSKSIFQAITHFVRNSLKSRPGHYVAVLTD
jgi:hypothetical protein